MRKPSKRGRPRRLTRRWKLCLVMGFPSESSAFSQRMQEYLEACKARKVIHHSVVKSEWVWATTCLQFHLFPCSPTTNSRHRMIPCARGERKKAESIRKMVTIWEACLSDASWCAQSGLTSGLASSMEKKWCAPIESTTLSSLQGSSTKGFSHLWGMSTIMNSPYRLGNPCSPFIEGVLLYRFTSMAG